MADYCTPSLILSLVGLILGLAGIAIGLHSRMRIKRLRKLIDDALRTTLPG